MLLSKIQSEIKVEQLAKAYRKKFLEYDFKIPSLEKLKESKWWIFFINTIDNFGNQEEWNPYLFVESVFVNNGKIYPYFLPRKSNWDYFLNYKNSKVEKTDITEILKLLIQDYNKIKKIMKDKNIISFNDFFNNDYCKRLVDSKIFDGLLFYFIRSYIKAETPSSILSKKIMLYRNKNILNKLKEILKDELYIDDVIAYINKIGE